MFSNKYCRAVAIIQARLSSTRLPRKVLKKIGNKTILQHTVDRTKEAEYVDEVVVASPHRIPAHRVEVWDSIDENDVLSRYYLCALVHKADLVIRITADCPLLDPYWIDFCINVLIWGDYDYVTNRPFCPDGLDVEVFTFDALQSAFYEATSPYDREHVTPYIRKNFKMAETELDGFISKVKFSVDTKTDLKRVRRIYGFQR